MGFTKDGMSHRPPSYPCCVAFGNYGCRFVVWGGLDTCTPETPYCDSSLSPFTARGQPARQRGHLP